MKCPFCIKVCTKCNKILVAWKGNFCKKKNGKYGLRSECKLCEKEYKERNKERIKKKKKEWAENNKKRVSENHKKWREENKDEIKEKKHIYYEEHKEERLKYQKQYREEHKEEIAEKQKQYREEHKEEIAEKCKKRYEENKEKIRKKRKIRYQLEKEKSKEYNKKYYENNPHVRFNNNIKRRQLEENQGRGITKEQWLEMMEYFDWCCAYSGEYIGGDNKDKRRTIDHIIALDNGGLNEPYNCVPMLKSYNSQKRISNMEEWYQQQEFYSEERLQKIYAWCEYAFNKWKPRRKGNCKKKEKRIKL